MDKDKLTVEWNGTLHEFNAAIDMGIATGDESVCQCVTKQQSFVSVDIKPAEEAYLATALAYQHALRRRGVLGIKPSADNSLDFHCNYPCKLLPTKQPEE